MSDLFFLALRRLRAPLIALISAYAIATIGMVLIPGITPTGEPYSLSFFEAFYFVSYMGTTIGFGELPYPFTSAQRAWVLVGVYTSVFSWLYAIGNILKLVQDPTFQRAIAERSFRSSIMRIEQPFYIICGFGETGALINRGLSKLGILTVVIDFNEQRTRSLELEDLRFAPIVLTANATDPENLLKAGLNRSYCHGIIAVTEDDHTNLQIAVSCKLLNNSVSVFCRSEIQDEAANMESFGTDVIVNPFITFANRLYMLAHKPELHRIQNWLINQQSPEHITDRNLPKGRWILCGYGRLGKAIQEKMTSDGIELTIVDSDPIASNAPDGTIVGRGTEAKTLQEAGIEDASLIIAASDDDANNLSILITAKQLNKDIYTIGRVSNEANQVLFKQAYCDYIMRRSLLVASEVLTSISRPLVSKFLRYSGSLSEADTSALINSIKKLTRRTNPVTYRLCLWEPAAPALVKHIENGASLTISDVCWHPSLPTARCLPLLLERNGVSQLLPESGTELQIGDQLMVCGNRKYPLLPERLLDNSELIDSLINQNRHYIPLLRWLDRRSAKASNLGQNPPPNN